MTSYGSILRMCFLLVLLIASAPHARADGESLTIAGLSPQGAVTPGTTITFVANPSAGFFNPAYSVSDSFSASGATMGTIDKAGYFTWTPTIYDAGRHTLTVSVSDVKNRVASSTVSILITSNSVIASGLTPGPVIRVNMPVSFTLVAPGFINPSFAVYDSYSMSSVNSSNINSSGAFSWKPNADDLGSHTLTVVASDLYGHSAQATQKITVIAPTVSVQSLSPGSGVGVGSPLTFKASAPLLSGNSTTTYSVSDIFTGTTTLTSSAMSSAGTFNWKPASADLGYHTLMVSATDAYGNVASTTLMLSVLPASTAPTPASAVVPTAATTIITTNTTLTTSVTKFVFTKNLTVGSKGTEVLELQKKLISLGYLSGSATGYFGALTTAGVKKFQATHGLARVGNVGPATRAALNK